MRIAACFVFVVIVFSGTATSAPIPKHLPKEGDQEKMQGKWTLEPMKNGPGEMRMEVKGDTIKTFGAEDIVTAKFKLDVVDGLRRLNLTEVRYLDRTENVFEKGSDETWGYLLVDNKLMIAKGPDNGPIDPAKAGDDSYVLVFVRPKDKK